MNCYLPGCTQPATRAIRWANYPNQAKPDRVCAGHFMEWRLNPQISRLMIAAGNEPRRYRDG